MAFIQLVYTSTAASGLTEAEVLEILWASQEKNAQKKISGLLVYRNGRFTQLLEGDEAEVLALYKRIEEDSRHGSVAIAGTFPAGKAAMPTWAMAYFSPTVSEALRRDNASILDDDHARRLCQALPPHIASTFLAAFADD